jgi:hypothetical protein
MAKSPTAKKSKIKRQAVRQVKIELVETAADLASSYVKSWAKTEVNKLILDSAHPVIVPIKNGLQVNLHKVIKHNNACWKLFNRYNEQIAEFSHKKSAVLYSILYQQSKYSSADTVLRTDQMLSKLEADFNHYSHNMHQAIQRKNHEAIDILAARYYDTQLLLNEARNELEKTLRMNKYLKVWETGNNYETK